MEENTRLSDLTRMLLSSQAFSGFLNELSQNGMPAPATTAVSSQPQPQPTKKDINPHQATRQAQNQQTQVGMTIVPETTIDFSMLDSTATSNWNTGFGMNSYQVCAVTELPEGPAIDTDLLSGKSSDITKSSNSSAKDYPVLQFPALVKQQDSPLPATQVDDNVELDEAAFTLFFDQPKVNALAVVERALASDHPSSHNVSASVQPVIEEPESEEERWKRLESMCSTLDASWERLSVHTSHIS
jgi:bZIP-type transcription factor MBZ1